MRAAISDDPRPLFVIFQGPITDMAAAYLANPEIAGPVTVIWTDGGPWSEDG